MQKFIIEDSFRGYENKGDITKIDPRFLVDPSQNVIVDSDGKIKIRPGYELDGPAGTTNEPVVASYDWNNNSDTDPRLRVTGGILQYRYVDSAGAVTWRTLGSGYGSDTKFNFTEWWDNSEVEDLLLFSYESTDIGMWSGGVTTVDSVTTNTITKEGTKTWGESRFLTSGTMEVVIGGNTYTYTGGVGTTTLTGVSPDPVVAGVSSTDIVHQGVVVTANLVSSSFIVKNLHVSRNQLHVMGQEYREVYVSKNTDYTDFAFTSPVRKPGEGAILTLDSNATAFVDDEGVTYIGAKTDDWYQIEFKLSADLVYENLTIKKLKSGPGQGALSQSAVGKIKNAILYINNDKAVDTLGRLENIETPQSDPISDRIQKLLESYDYTIEPHVMYHRGKTNIAIPSENVRLIYDHELSLWNPPQLIPVRRFSVVDGQLHGHSTQTDETYKLDTGTNDNGLPIIARAYFAYNNLGNRYWEKKNDEFFNEGYIARNTV